MKRIEAVTHLQVGQVRKRGHCTLLQLATSGHQPSQAGERRQGVESRRRAGTMTALDVQRDQLRQGRGDAHKNERTKGEQGQRLMGACNGLCLLAWVSLPASSGSSASLLIILLHVQEKFHEWLSE